MLAIISFTLLGIWTGILGIINNCGYSSDNKPSQNLKTFLEDKKVLFQQRPVMYENSEAQDQTKVEINNDNINNNNEPSETFKAFQNLWKQIVHRR